MESQEHRNAGFRRKGVSALAVGVVALTSIPVVAFLTSRTSDAADGPDVVLLDTSGADRADPKPVGAASFGGFANHGSSIKPVDLLVSAQGEPPGRIREPTAPVPRVAIYGDSSALGLASNSGTYTGSPDRLLQKVSGVITLGCGITMSHSWCKTAEEWGATAATNLTQITIVYSGAWETECLRPTDETWTECRAIGDPVFDDYLTRHLTERSDALFAAGVEQIVFVKQEIGPGGQSDRLARPNRWKLWYELLDEFAATDDRVSTIDIRPWFRGQGDQRALRPDGLHVSELAWVIWRDFLEEEIYWKLWKPYVEGLP